MKLSDYWSHALWVYRQEKQNTVLSRHGTLGNDSPIPSVFEFYAAFSQREPDLDKPKFHLKKSGVVKVTVDLFASGRAYSGSVDGALLITTEYRAQVLNLAELYPGIRDSKSDPECSL